MKKNSLYLFITFLAAAIIIGYGAGVFFEFYTRPKVAFEIKSESVVETKVKGESPLDDVTTTKAPLKFPNLRLEGTIISGIPAAYIRDLDSQEASYYNIGDEVLNAKVVDIKRGMAALDMEGKKIVLYLEKSYMDSPIWELSDTLRVVMRDKLLELINSEEGDLKANLEMKPHLDKEGNFRGYEIKGVKTGSLPYLGGLRNGDIIKEINKQKLSSEQKSIQTFKKVRKLQDIDLVVSRDKKDVNLTYKVDKK